MKKASLISIGNEILAGRTVDTNAAYLSRRLLAMGIPVVNGFTVSDDIDSIIQALTRAAEAADIVLITGGLGPTDDDITRQAVANFMNVELEFRQELLDDISSYFAKRNISMAEKNKVQAYMPAGTKAIKNDLGTAPGIMAEYKGRLFVAMPGVPAEMQAMFTESVAEKLQGLAGQQAIVIKKLQCFGTGESVIAQKLGDLMNRNRQPLINCTVSGGVITLHIIAVAEKKDRAAQAAEKDAARIRDILGDLVFGQDEQKITDVVGTQLTNSGKTIAIAESCTGGLLAKMLTDTPGATAYFMAGWITYSNQAKIRDLGLDAHLIESHGAVSPQVAKQMASAARAKAQTDIALAITGIAGPGGGTEQKPVGLVYIAVDTAEKCEVKRCMFPLSSRENIRQRSALTALNMIRLELKV